MSRGIGYHSYMKRCAFCIAIFAGVATLLSQTGADFQKDFPVEKKTLGTRGSNPYFNLTPGYQLSYTHGKDTDTLTVLDVLTKQVGIRAMFSDWPATTTFYASCMGMK